MRGRSVRHERGAWDYGSGRRQSYCFEIVAGGPLHTFKPASDVPRVRFVKHIINARVTETDGVEYSLRFFTTIGFPHFFHVRHRQHHSFEIAQRNFAPPWRQRFRELFSDIQGDRNRPKSTCRQPHLAANALVIGFRHKAVQRRKTSVEEQLKITKLSGGYVPGRKFPRLGPDLRSSLGTNVKVDKLAAVGNRQMSGGSAFQTINRFAVVHLIRAKVESYLRSRPKQHLSPEEYMGFVKESFVPEAEDRRRLAPYRRYHFVGEAASFGASEATIFSKRGSPRSGSHKGNSLSMP